MTKNTPLCSTCRNPDGTLNVDLMEDEGSCTFGCGVKVDTDYGICPRCKDHSENVYECEDCGRIYSRGFDPSGVWE